MISSKLRNQIVGLSFYPMPCDMQIAKARSSLKHSEVVIARQAVEEGRGLVVIVNKMDLLRGKQNSIMHEVMDAVPKEIQTVIPQV